MGAGAEDTVQTNPQDEDAGRGDAQRVLMNETVFAAMGVGRSDCPILCFTMPITRLGPARAPWPHSLISVSAAVSSGHSPLLWWTPSRLPIGPKSNRSPGSG